jgi:SulP family sulfate permease
VVFAILLVFNSPLVAVLKKTGLKPSLVLSISKCGSLLAIIVTTVAIHFLDLATQNGVATIGFVPSGLPVIAFDFFNFPKWRALLPYAVFIALISFVESVALAKITAKYSGEKIIPNQELIALGFANIMAGISGAMPVAGGLSRTMVNYAAGAKTQIATLIAAIIVGFIVVFFSIWFAEIPKATLAVIILVSVFPLVRLKKIVQTFEYDSGDGMAETATFLGVIVLGIEQGIVLGIVITLISFLRKTSQPYIAILGRIEGTEQFRNIRRYEVETWEHLLLLRIDENISFANVSYVDDYLAEILNKQPEIRHIVLVLTAISDIDATGLEALEDLNRRFQKQNINMHLSDVKGPLLEKLKRTLFFEHLKPGEVFMCTNDAVEKLV